MTVTLIINDKGQYVPFMSRALGSPALAKALRGKPLYARVRKMGRGALGQDTECADQNRKYRGEIAKRRRLRKSARATRQNRGQRKQHNRRGHAWNNGHPSAMSSRSW